MNNIWMASAPANIALIKYMGKTNAEINQASNASFSYTLDHCRTFVELQYGSNISQDDWEVLQFSQENNCQLESFNLSDAGRQRFLKHLKRLKKYFKFEGNFLVRSGNNFPADCGLASSASSYAALTLAACKALADLTKQQMPSLTEMTKLSREASGSSCRSFMSPWCLWEETKQSDEIVKAIELPYQRLIHLVFVVSSEKKSVSSSAAHQKIKSSLLFNKRDERVALRLKQLLQALKSEKWKEAYQLCWQEFWDMHALFQTSDPAFGYMLPDSLLILNELQSFWEQHQDGPIVTMDAGANVHCLFRNDQMEMVELIKNQYANKFKLISSAL